MKEKAGALLHQNGGRPAVPERKEQYCERYVRLLSREWDGMYDLWIWLDSETMILSTGLWLYIDQIPNLLYD